MTPKDSSQNSIVFLYFSNKHVALSTCLEILSFLKVFLRFDETFLKNEIILKNSEKNENILEQFFVRTENYDDFEDFVENEFKISNSKLKSSLTGLKTSLFHIAQKSEKNQEKFVNFLKNKFDGNILNELVSLECLYGICQESDRF